MFLYHQTASEDISIFDIRHKGADAVKEIYEKASNPIAIIAHPDFVNRKSRDSVHKVIALVDLNIDGRQVIAPIEVDVLRTLGIRDVDTNNVCTYFDKNNLDKILGESVALENQKKTGFYYADIKKVEALLKRSGFQLPSPFRTHDSNIIIRQIDENVNRKSVLILRHAFYI